jgi:putative MFS transporter
MTDRPTVVRPTTHSDPSEIAARIDRIPTGRFHVRLASKLALGTFFDGFDAISLAVVLSLVVATFQISFATAGTIIAAGYLGQFVGAIVIGWLSERFGRKRTFVVSLIVFSLLSIGCALAWSATSLMVFRLVQGFGLGAEVPLAGTLINEYLGRKNRGRVAVLYQSAFSWGLFFAPLVALVLTSTLEPELAWRVLLAVGVIPLVVAIWAAISLPESARWLATRGRHAEADAYVEQMEREATAQGVVLDAPSVLPAQPHREFRPSELFSGQYGRRTLTLALLWFTGYFVVYGYSVWLPSLYVQVGGLAPSKSVLLTILVGLIVITMNYVTAWLVERIGRKKTLVMGFGIAAFGGLYGLFCVAVLHDTSWPVLFSTGCLIALGITVPAGALYFYTGELYPTRMRGFATSSASSVARLASVISPFIIGPLLDTGGAATIFGLLGAVSLLGTIVVAVAGVETRNRSLEEISA